MKRFFCTLLCILLLGGCASPAYPPSAQTTEEIRAVWISCMELTMDPAHCSEKDFETRARKMVGDIRNARMNTVFLHVRPFSDALYRSEIYPFSACLTGTEGRDPGYDPLRIFCRLAGDAGVSVHAWLNPFRIGRADTLSEKSAHNPAVQILRDDDPDNDRIVVRVGDTLYYDPASTFVHDLIERGIRELLENYAIDGIHIDDYFYPGTDGAIDKTEYDAYRQSGGALALDDWRRSVVSHWVASVYRVVKSYDGKVFSISPSAQIDRNHSLLYADVERWAAYDGYCDWLIPQLYFGFRHETCPFHETAAQWSRLKTSGSVRLLAGLAAYKCGRADAYAGAGADEWLQRHDLLSGQIRDIRALQGYGGFALFSYSYVFDRNLLYNSEPELYSLLSVL